MVVAVELDDGSCLFFDFKDGDACKSVRDKQKYFTFRNTEHMMCDL